MRFLGSVSLHPSAALLVCLIAIVVIQFLGWLGLALVFPVLLLATRKSISGWWHLLRRMRWLLVSVWLILAYGASGEAVFDVAWMPTHEGVRDATLHVARLGLMLGCLAWLFAVLGNQGLLVALQSLLRPLSRLGLASERFAGVKGCCLGFRRWKSSVSTTWASTSPTRLPVKS
jgi:energy-coupling factor transporter transmembrane protein EcfT